MRNELNKSEVVPGAPVETVPHALFGTSSGAIMVTGWKRLMDGFEGVVELLTPDGETLT